jgi:hypothetical protein
MHASSKMRGPPEKKPQKANSEGNKKTPHKKGADAINQYGKLLFP